MSETNRLMVVDDDPEIRELFEIVAASLGFETAQVCAPGRLIETLRAFRPSVILLDLIMPGCDGIDVLHALGHERCKADIVLLSRADPRVIRTAARVAAMHDLRIREVLRKPIALNNLETTLAALARPASDAGSGDLLDAIENGQIHVVYQPKVSLSGDACVFAGVEALARWHHPSRGLFLPGDFVPAAEQSGAIGALTEHVTETALADVASLCRNGYLLDLAVNLSPYLLADCALPDRLARRIEAHGLGCSQFIVEITENAAQAEGPFAVGNLARFRLRGIRLSMDDFGTGYSSLVSLHRAPFSELKIDRSFIREVDHNDEARIIGRSVVDLAHDLELNVCAEGVETRAQLDFVRSIGCDQAQGRLIAGPVTARELSDLLARGVLPPGGRDQAAAQQHAATAPALPVAASR